jgi:hypothetical protein
MYNTEVKDIQGYVHSKGPQGLVDVASFVLATIQTPLVRTKEQVYDIKIRKEDSKALWGFKKAGYEAVKQDSRKLYKAFVERPESLPWSIYTMMSYPGFGMVKGSFLLQCLGYDIGCIDSHNLRLYNISESEVKVPAKLKIDKKMERVHLYIDLCGRLGGAENLWDNWCTHVAAQGKMNKRLSTPEEVSRFHYEVISQ